MKRFLIALALIASCSAPSSPATTQAPVTRFSTAYAGAGEAFVYDEEFGATGGAEVSFDTVTTTNRSSAMGPGRWYLYCTQDCWLKRGTTTVTTAAAIASGDFLAKGTYVPVQVTPQDIGARDQWAAIGDTASGKLRILRASRSIGR